MKNKMLSEKMDILESKVLEWMIKKNKNGCVFNYLLKTI
jgi:hypothetical protein